MVELTEKAAQYAAEKSNEVIANALAKAYEDGYRDGYKDREEEIPVDMRDNRTEYVDLGLPSGTLWAKDYEKEEGNIIYLPFEQAEEHNLPTEQQWYELDHLCRWEFQSRWSSVDRRYNKTFDCIGPNGNYITFYGFGFTKSIGKENIADVYFWLSNITEDINKKAVHMFRNQYINGIHEGRSIEKMFSGYKLPIRLVKTK